MYNTALRIVNQTADAEDVLQEAFTDAFIQIKSFERKSTFGAWLKKIVIYKSVNFLKRKHTSFVDIENIKEPEEELKETDEEMMQMAVSAIKRKIRALPDGYRTVLSLYLLEGYDHEEIAQILGITHTTVRTQYSRAKQRLLTALKEDKDE